jgi:hypothetical protein
MGLHGSHISIRASAKTKCWYYDGMDSDEEFLPTIIPLRSVVPRAHENPSSTSMVAALYVDDGQRPGPSWRMTRAQKPPPPKKRYRKSKKTPARTERSPKTPPIEKPPRKLNDQKRPPPPKRSQTEETPAKMTPERQLPTQPRELSPRKLNDQKGAQTSLPPSFHKSKFFVFL